MPRIKKILAPTDLSDLSKLGVRYAMEMARDGGAEIIVYHAIDVGDWLNLRPEFAVPRDLLEESRRQLDQFLADNFSDCINLVELRQMVELGAPHKNIVTKAAGENVDLIVMSTHGRTGVDHLMLGSVTERVAARAPCPLLIVPRSGRERNSARAA